MKKILLSALLAFGAGWAATAADAAESVSFRFDMVPNVAIDSTPSSGRVTGMVPPGWRENSEWAQCHSRYEPLADAGTPGLRVRVERLDSGYNQLDAVLAAPLPPGDYVLTLRTRQRGRARLNFGVRQIGAPYRWVAKFAAMPGAEWRTLTRRFTLDKPVAAGTHALMLQIDGVTAIDFAGATLSRIDGAATTTAATAAERAGGNGFRQASMALGLPSGWSLHNCFSQGDHVRIEPSGRADGPSGAPGLRIVARGGVMTSYDYAERLRINGPPLAVGEADREYVVEFSVRGSGSGAARLYAGNRKLAEAAWTVDHPDAWHRVRMATTPETLQPLVPELDVDGDLEFDGWYAGPAEAPRDAPYVELALAPSDASEADIVFADEVPAFRWLARRVPAGARLRFAAINLYGDREESFAATAGTEASGEFRFAPRTPRTGGTWRIEAAVVDAAGRVAGDENERVFHWLPRPKHWGNDAPDSPFGVHVQPASRQLAMAKAIGNNWVRLHDAGVQLLGWAYLERKPGEWTFDDAGVERYRRHRLTILGELTTAPAWRTAAARAGMTPPPLSRSVTAPYFLPTDLDDYQAYAETVVKRYGRHLAAYDVWNEPWLPLFFHTDYVKKVPEGHRRWASFGGGFYLSPEDPSEVYADMQRRVFGTVRAAGSTAPVMGFNTTDGKGHEGRVPGDAFTAAMKARGALATCDRISYHQYLTRVVGHPGDAAETGRDFALGPLKDADGALPKTVWFTEGSPLNDPPGSFYRLTASALGTGGDPAELFDAGDRVVRFATRLLALGNEKLFLYSMGVFSGYRVVNPHRLFVDVDGAPHPAAAAYAAFTRRIEGKRFAGYAAAGENVHAYRFVGEGEAATVLLPDPRRGGHRFPAPPPGVAERDLFGNPVSERTPEFAARYWSEEIR